MSISRSMNTKLADGTVVVATVSWFGLHAAQLALAVQIIGGICVAVSAITATIYHIRAMRKL